jgi:KaiC domain protein
MELVSTGVDGLDEMLGGGLPKGHVVTVLGSFGTGKSTLGLMFLLKGLINNEKGIFITLEEEPESLNANAASFGWDLSPYVKDKKLALIKLEPADAKATITRVKGELPEFIKKFGAQRIVIDSVSLLGMMFADDVERRARLFSLCNQIRKTDATCIFTAETKDDNPYSSRDGIVEYVSDGVISLRFIYGESRSVQLVTQIIKMRRHKHSRDPKPYNITDKGIEVHSEVEVF